jgi:hypothetical protein
MLELRTLSSFDFVFSRTLLEGISDTCFSRKAFILGILELVSQGRPGGACFFSRRNLCEHKFSIDVIGRIV